MITAENYLYYVLLFFTGSILGWCIEVCCKLIQYHRFINRGFLVGPWCPIYGFGTVFISVLLTRYSEDANFSCVLQLIGRSVPLATTSTNQAVSLLHASIISHNICIFMQTKSLKYCKRSMRNCMDFQNHYIF